MTLEHFFVCPHCWQTISVVLDLSSRGQSYVEDCEVCCHPILIHYQTEDGELTEFEAKAN